MSVRLMVEVMNDAPDTLTWRERYLLLVFAENFNDETRRGWPGYEGDDERSKAFRRKVRLSRGQYYSTLGSLIRKGVLEQVVRGQKHRQAVYRIPPLATVLSVPETETLSGSAGGFPEGSGNTHGGITESPQGPGNPDPEGLSGSRFGNLRVPETETPIPQYSSNQDLLKDANAAREGWGVWGEGSATAPADADPQPATASAGATAGDGASRLAAAPRPRDTDRSGDDDEPMPPPVAEVLKNAAAGEPSRHPGVGDLVPRQIQHAQRQYDPKPAARKPAGWAPGQEAERAAELERITAVLEATGGDMLHLLELLMFKEDFAAINRGRRLATEHGHLVLGVDDADPERLRRQRLWGLVYTYNERPLAAWPEGILPLELRAPGSVDAA